MFGLSDSSWAEDQKLIADDAESGDRFGFSVSTDGAGVAIGADLDDDNGMDAGAVYVYESDGAPQPPTAKQYRCGFRGGTINSRFAGIVR